MKKIVLVLIAAAVMSFGLSQAMAFKPAVVFDMGGKARRAGIPQALAFRILRDLTDAHFMDFGLVADFNIRLRLQVAVPGRILWRSTLGCHQNVARAIHGPHQRGLADSTGLPAPVGHDYDRQAGVPQT